MAVIDSSMSVVDRDADVPSVSSQVTSVDVKI